jgi:hypothetical protein
LKGVLSAKKVFLSNLGMPLLDLQDGDLIVAGGVNQLAHMLVAEATSEQRTQQPSQPEKNPAAVALGRLGGLKGGKARADKLGTERRKEIAQQAAKARWGNKG